jgi:hypothetical protein
MAIETGQFLLRDELGHAPAHLGIGIRRQFQLLAGGDIDNEQRAVAHKAGKAALRAQLRIGLGFRSLGQPPGGAVKARQPQIAVHRHQQAPGIGCPVIIGDALHIGNAAALAVHPLGFRQGAGAGQGRRIDQHPALPGGGVHGPQIEAVAIIRAALEQCGKAAIGGQLEHTRTRPGQRGRREHAVQRERSGLGSRLRCRAASRHQQGRCRRPHHCHHIAPIIVSQRLIAAISPCRHDIAHACQCRTLAAAPSGC